MGPGRYASHAGMCGTAEHVAVQTVIQPPESRIVWRLTMDLDMHHAIAGKLEAGKAAGWLSEYLVAWHGAHGKLAPSVTVWRTHDQNDDAVKAYVNGLLSDLVSVRDIVIADV